MKPKYPYSISPDKPFFSMMVGRTILHMQEECNMSLHESVEAIQTIVSNPYIEYSNPMSASIAAYVRAKGADFDEWKKFESVHQTLHPMADFDRDTSIDGIE